MWVQEGSISEPQTLFQKVWLRVGAHEETVSINYEAPWGTK